MIKFRAGDKVRPTKKACSKYKEYYTKGDILSVTFRGNSRTDVKLIVWNKDHEGYLPCTSEYFTPCIQSIKIGGELL